MLAIHVWHDSRESRAKPIRIAGILGYSIHEHLLHVFYHFGRQLLVPTRLQLIQCIAQVLLYMVEIGGFLHILASRHSESLYRAGVIVTD